MTSEKLNYGLLQTTLDLKTVIQGVLWTRFKAEDFSGCRNQRKPLSGEDGKYKVSAFFALSTLTKLDDADDS